MLRNVSMTCLLVLGVMLAQAPSAAAQDVETQEAGLSDSANIANAPVPVYPDAGGASEENAVGTSATDVSDSANIATAPMPVYPGTEAAPSDVALITEPLVVPPAPWAVDFSGALDEFFVGSLDSANLTQAPVPVYPESPERAPTETTPEPVVESPAPEPETPAPADAASPAETPPPVETPPTAPEVTETPTPPVADPEPVVPPTEIAKIEEPTKIVAPEIKDEPTTAATCADELRAVNGTGVIQFDASAAKLSPETTTLLDKFASVLKSTCGKSQVEIGGHTDSSGYPDRNRRISAERALAVLDYLVKAGVDPNLIAAKAYGSSKPRVVDETTSQNRAKNRRIEFLVVGE